ncbi:MAG: hemolysin family protein [Acidimicrobiia bacterium]|jgi:putative hemolysin
MGGTWPQLLLVLALVAVNGVLAGSEIALISLRESQIARLERRGGSGRVVARLARNPNRFLATIQIGITLAGFLASAAAAVTLSQPLVPYLGFLGASAQTAAIVVVTLILSFVTLVLGELAPKRLALQRAEGWAVAVGRPLHWLAVATTPIVWLLGVSTDIVVRLFGGEPGSTREEIDLEELREMVAANRVMHEDHQEVLLGAFEVAERRVGEVLVPRPDVFTLDEDMTAADGVRAMVDARHTRIPVVLAGSGLDGAIGTVSLRDLVAAEPGSRLRDLAAETLVFPESVPVLAALRSLQEARQQMAFVVDEFGGIEGIVTIEDLVEELVGEIYDESDRDVISARRGTDGSVVVTGRFPVHDLVDLGIEAPEGDYRTVAGLVLDRLGRIPKEPGDEFEIGRWRVVVLTIDGRTIGEVRFQPVGPPAGPAD